LHILFYFLMSWGCFDLWKLLKQYLGMRLPTGEFYFWSNTGSLILCISFFDKKTGIHEKRSVD
jgi:hypothetical protein